MLSCRLPLAAYHSLLPHLNLRAHPVITSPASGFAAEERGPRCWTICVKNSLTIPLETYHDFCMCTLQIEEAQANIKC